jgi:cobalamin biosynthesis protein CobT
MINPHRVGQLLIDLISKQSASHNYNPAHNARDEDVTKVLYKHMESIAESTHYAFETEYTIDITHDADQDRHETEEIEIGDSDDAESNMEEEAEGEDSDETESDESTMEMEEEEEKDDTYEPEGEEVSMKEEEDGENEQLHHLSIEYMKNVLDFYDEMNAKTGRRKHTWKSLEHRFPKVKNRNYIERFRRYLNEGGTKRVVA